MKIDREKFLAAAMLTGAMCATGCYVQDSPPRQQPPPQQPPPAQPVAQQPAQPAPAPAPAPGAPAQPGQPGQPGAQQPGAIPGLPPGFQPPPGWTPPPGFKWPAPSAEGGTTPTAPTKEK